MNAITKERMLEWLDNADSGYPGDDDNCGVRLAIRALILSPPAPRNVTLEDFEEWAYELRGWMDTDGIKTILRNRLRDLGIAEYMPIPGLVCPGGELRARIRAAIEAAP